MANNKAAVWVQSQESGEKLVVLEIGNADLTLQMRFTMDSGAAKAMAMALNQSAESAESRVVVATAIPAVGRA
jgi:predicted nucleic acid-binding protein